MSNIERLIRDTRPLPPDDLVALDGGGFVPDQDGLGEWALRTFISVDGALTNPRHSHLRDAFIGWLWTDTDHKAHDKRAAATCQIVQPTAAKWPSARAAFQLRQWFGSEPDVLITVSAPIAALMDDFAFCALIEHELCHIAQDLDPFDAPRFGLDGRPIFAMAGHDVEEFVDVVARYGADATRTRRLVDAANKGPTVAAARVAMACGTCMGRKVG